MAVGSAAGLRTVTGVVMLCALGGLGVVECSNPHRFWRDAGLELIVFYSEQ
jgi:hypothetical protein